MKMNNGEILIYVDQQGLTTGLKELGVKPGDLFLAHGTPGGGIVMQPARVEKITKGETHP